MESCVNLCVSWKGESQSVLVSDAQKTTWADVEAMVLLSFDLRKIQIKYLDEEKEEVSVNSQGEYEEALKIALKQGGFVQMNVYENQQLEENEESPSSEELQEPKTPNVTLPLGTDKISLGQQTTLASTGGQELERGRAYSNSMEQHTSIQNEGSTVIPPQWFTSYMDRFKEQIVRETVERVSQSLRENPTQDWMSDSSNISEVQKDPEKKASAAYLYDWSLDCSNCNQRIIGIRYQCSSCASFNICENCETQGFGHEPNHLYLKMRRPLKTKLKDKAPYPHDEVSASLGEGRQNLQLEKKQRKAEQKQLKKQLKLQRGIHRWWLPEISFPESSPLVIPIEPCPQIIPTVSAVFVDENVPDGTHLQPGTKFIKQWRMKNTGNIKWNIDTKLTFMWGNLTLGSSSHKESPVPSLLPNEVGTLSVEFMAPALEGTYTSHWRLTHKGDQFGPRVWCNIIVDSLSCSESMDLKEKCTSSSHTSHMISQEESGTIESVKRHPGISIPEMIRAHNSKEEFIPSVDLLTPQDLLSFELLDINIVQELEDAPHNTPVDMTPCLTPVSHDGPVIDRLFMGQTEEGIKEAGNVTNTRCIKSQKKVEKIVTAEDADMSGTQFVCETVIRSLTLDAAPDYNPPQKISPDFTKPVCLCEREGNIQVNDNYTEETESKEIFDSFEDAIIILPECFDTSRPIGESMHSSDKEKEKETKSKMEDEILQEAIQSQSDINDIFTSQAINDVTPTLELLSSSSHLRFSQKVQSSVVHMEMEPEPASIRAFVPEQESRGENCPFVHSRDCTPALNEDYELSRKHTGMGIAGGLVKGALSVAASAYKPLCSEDKDGAMMAVLLEMGFCNRQRNKLLLHKHNYNLVDVVAELIQMNENDSTR
ncbi:hypothetical protein GDO86_014377 [Hymenochirus boettgeri]|uniref:Next to BRCA1 gene 1 protein n=1 Tax=Hymenochirus boettgeri TaxID=247094 RepID=A0A8T2JTJ9_9PIPI|nr:hypothetical protein GDO86_014377 [Hymenochirus boettgeri]